jgi:hypothetical protein
MKLCGFEVGLNHSLFSNSGTVIEQSSCATEMIIGVNVTSMVQI